MVDGNAVMVCLDLLRKKVQGILNHRYNLKTELLSVGSFITSGIFKRSIRLPGAPKRRMLMITGAGCLDSSHLRHC